MEARRCNEIERKGDSQLLWRHDGVGRTLTTGLLDATTRLASLTDGASDGCNGADGGRFTARRTLWSRPGLRTQWIRGIAEAGHLYWNKGFILVHLERRLHSTNRSHLNGRRIHVVRVLLVRGVLACNGVPDLALIEELRLEPLATKIEDEHQHEQGDHKKGRRVHYGIGTKKRTAFCLQRR